MDILGHLMDIAKNGQDGWDRVYKQFPLLKKLTRGIGIGILLSIPVLTAICEVLR